MHGFKSLLTLITLCIIASFHVSAYAIPVKYKLTFDTFLNNPDGSWGGNLNIGDRQDINLSIVYLFNSIPRFQSSNEVRFDLINLQVFDNTNSLASDVIYGSGSMVLEYGTGGNNDGFRGAGYGFPGGSLIPFGESEFGEPGDEIPYGAAFDAVINASDMNGPIARADDFYPVRNYIAGWYNENRGIPPGSFVFMSQPVPEPGTLLMMGIGLAGLGIARKRKKL